MESAQTENYDRGIVRWFVIMAVVYLAASTLLGVYISAELAWPGIALNNPYLTFAHLRPLHGNMVIFAFGGCALMAAAYHSVQHTCGVRLWNITLAWLTFLGWNLIVVYVVTSLHLGPLYSGVAHATLRGLIDIASAIVLLTFALNLMMTVVTRKNRQIHISNWFFLGMTGMIIFLYAVNGAPVPVSMADTYSQSAGLQDGAKDLSTIAYYLTAGFLGIFYYFLPQQTNRPLFSRHLAVFHFWTLVIGCVWLGVHYQQYFPLPGWVEGLGAVLSLAIILATLGAAANGIKTISGAREVLRRDYILHFVIVSLGFFVISISQNPAVSFNAVNELSSYTDWTSDPSHSGALGWIVMLGCGAIYHLVEKLGNTRMYSARLVSLHFWMFIIGMIVYFAAIKIAGMMQAVMWSSYDEYGNLAYTFAESVEAMHPYYVMRVIGGAIFSTGVVLMLFNTLMTIRQTVGQRGDDTETAQAA